jgi:hypothetical protein
VSLKKVYIVDFKVTENNANIYLNTNGGKIKKFSRFSYVIYNRYQCMRYDCQDKKETKIKYHVKCKHLLDE